MSLAAPESSSSSSSNGDAKLSRPSSSLSNSMTSEDWDKSFSGTPHANSDLPLPGSSTAEGGVGVGGEGGERNRRSLSGLMRLYGEHGKDLQLSAEEEKVLSEELGLWINSDSSPYEGDDSPNAPKQ